MKIINRGNGAISGGANHGGNGSGAVARVGTYSLFGQWWLPFHRDRT